MHKIECFKIRLLAGEPRQTWDVEQLTPLHDILCHRHPLSLNPVVIVADPFLFVHAGRLHLFYEEKRNYSPGVLRMTSTDDLQHWTRPVTVLREPLHLSYPFVFSDGGSVYMIPETSDVGDIRLYQADDDTLRHFTFCQTLVGREVVEGETGYADSSVCCKDGVYYLLTSVERNRVNHLHLFTANRLSGPYTVHPRSPLCASAKYGRNGGCLLADGEGRLFRVAQDCVERYGDNVHLLQVDKLTATDYSEHLVRETLLPTSLPFYREGGHQYNFADFLGRRIVATDAKEYHRFTPYRMLHKSMMTLGRLFNHQPERSEH